MTVECFCRCKIFEAKFEGRDGEYFFLLKFWQLLSSFLPIFLGGSDWLFWQLTGLTGARLPR